MVEFHKHEDCNEVPDRIRLNVRYMSAQYVHEGGVELECDVGGTDVVAGAHHPLHEEGQSQREVEAVLGRNSKLFFLDCCVVFQKFLVLHLVEENNAHVEEAEHTVAQVAEDVVEVSDQTKWLSA